MSADEFTEFSNVVQSNMAVNCLYAKNCIEHLRPSLAWTAMHMESDSYLSCDILLKGSYGAAVEAASLVAFGLVRSAVLSLRSHYELSLQFLFYKDHPIERRSVTEFRSQPNLPGAIKKYLKDYFPQFEDRYKKLLKAKTRSLDDCYQLLSAIAHGSAINSISSATRSIDLVESEEIVSQSVTVFHDVGENLSDIYVSCFESNWLSLPEVTRKNLEKRFGKKNPIIELDL